MTSSLQKILFTALSLAALVLGGTVVLAQEETTTDPLLVSVDWDNGATAIADATPLDTTDAQWFHQFSTSGAVSRSANLPVFLVLENTSTGSKTTLCTYGQNAGLSFSVSYPACATGSQTVPHLINGNLVAAPAQPYRAYFADSAGTIINSPDGEGPLILPQLPSATLDQNIISVQSTLMDHPDGGEYYRFDIVITQTVPGQTLTFNLRTEENAVFVEESIGSLPITQGAAALPYTAPDEPLPDGSYELVAYHNGSIFRVFDIDPSIGVDNYDGVNNGSNSGSTGLGGLFSTTQLGILENGIVPDCGYDIQTQSNEGGTGRMCGLSDAITLIQQIIEYIFILILPIAAIVFVYVGFLYLTAGGNADKRSKAKNAMTKLVIGIVVILAAWLIVKSIVTSLGVNDNITEQFLDLDS